MKGLFFAVYSRFDDLNIDSSIFYGVLQPERNSTREVETYFADLSDQRQSKAFYLK
jgi:hypothetical protein